MKYRWMQFRDDGPWHFALDLRDLDQETRKAFEGTKHKAFRCRCGIEFQLPPNKTSETQPNPNTGELPCPRCVKSLYWEKVKADGKAKQQPITSQELVDAQM